MHTYQVFDPRDLWDKARRIEVYRYAKDLGHTEIVEAMPKDVMVARLKAKGVPPPSIPDRSIVSGPRSGDTNPQSHKSGPIQPKAEPETVQIDAAALAEREWQEQQKPLSYNEMRAELKASGLKLDRRWGKEEIQSRWETLKRGQ